MIRLRKSVFADVHFLLLYTAIVNALFSIITAIWSWRVYRRSYEYKRNYLKCIIIVKFNKHLYKYKKNWMHYIHPRPRWHATMTIYHHHHHHHHHHSRHRHPIRKLVKRMRHRLTIIMMPQYGTIPGRMGKWMYGICIHWHWIISDTRIWNISSIHYYHRYDFMIYVVMSYIVINY